GRNVQRGTIVNMTRELYGQNLSAQGGEKLYVFKVGDNVYADNSLKEEDPEGMVAILRAREESLKNITEAELEKIAIGKSYDHTQNGTSTTIECPGLDEAVELL